MNRTSLEVFIAERGVVAGNVLETLQEVSPMRRTSAGRSSILILRVLLILVFSRVTAQGAVNIGTDQIGRLTSSGTAQSRIFQEYDAAGRVLASQYTMNGHSSVFRAQFGYPQSTTATGPGTVVISETFPDGEIVNYAYDAVGNQVGIKSTLGSLTDDIVRDMRINARGQLTRTELGNGIVTTLQYDDGGALFLKRITAVNSNLTIQDYEYEYDDDANVTATVDNVRPSESFTLEYDELGQLTAMRNATGSVDIERYKYDAIGNLTRKHMTEQYYGTGGAAGRPHALDRSGGLAYEYDENGNVTRIGTATTLVWNADNMPITVTTGSVVAQKSYVGESLWKKVENGVTTYYLPALRAENAITRKYYGAFAERGGLDGSPNGRELRFYHPDHLGSSAVMTDRHGTPIHRVSYSPWGQERGAEGPFVPKLQFNFKEKDASGFYDYGARLYNPLTGRWLSPDTSLADGLNRYAYARNNPWTLIDPDGHETEPPQDKELVPPLFLAVPGWEHKDIREILQKYHDELVEIARKRQLEENRLTITVDNPDEWAVFKDLMFWPLERKPGHSAKELERRVGNGKLTPLQKELIGIAEDTESRATTASETRVALEKSGRMSPLQARMAMMQMAIGANFTAVRVSSSDAAMYTPKPVFIPMKKPARR
ncbi:MAG TPA: RHS repeat-associated core domain-containing protein [Thermoanaerobaculia bacterium]|nr:RHS repeat-associated core domain-containing protein [Thermoanaerobaculia bacterium]